MKFRWVILLAMVGIVAALMTASLAATTKVLERAARGRLTDELHRDRTILREAQRARQRGMESEARVVAEEPRLKAATSADEISRVTILGVANEMRRALGSDLFLLIDGNGFLLADVEAPDASGFDMKGKPVVAEAFEKGSAHGVWTQENTAFQIQARRLAFGAEIVGALVVGLVMDDAFLAAIRRQAGGIVALEVDGKIAARAIGEGPESASDAALQTALAAVPPGDAITEVTMEGARYLAVSESVAGYAGDRKVRYVMFESLDAALAPAERLQKIMLGIWAAAIFLAVLIAAALSGRLSRPIDGLVDFTRRVGRGDLGARAQPAGPIEMRSLAEAMNTMVTEIQDARDELAAKERLEQEMEIAERVQTSILPRDLGANGLEIAARMSTASEVGGDYYDVVKTHDGAWIGIGDVAGHGLPAGLVMLMLQSSVAGLTRVKPDARPTELVTILNHIIRDNVHLRMSQHEHVTFCLIRYASDGSLVFAGAHEEMFVRRASSGECETLDTPGTWLGAIDDIDAVTQDTERRLEPGDVLLLYTDGITEAMDAEGEMFGSERLRDAFVEAADGTPDEICDHVLERVREHMDTQHDDMTLVVARYVGAGGD